MRVPLDVLTESGEKTGKTEDYVRAHKLGLWHASSHVWIYNKNKEILLQKRALTKDSYPGLWDISVAGHVDAGETPLVAAQRELEEEIGISASANDLKFIKAQRVTFYIKEISWQNNEFVNIYLLEYNGNINELPLQVRETEEICFLSFDKFLEEIKDPNLSKKYAPHPIKDGAKIVTEINKILDNA